MGPRSKGEVAEVLDKFGGSLGTSGAPGRMMSADEAWRTTLLIRGPKAPTQAGPTPAALPYAKAFVVQFSAETDPRLGTTTGRVEHLQTGRRSRFASADELLAWIMAMLAGADAARRS